MPRSPRVEYEGARYHVLNRGNYRQALFDVHRTGEAFREILYQTCERYGWILHGYVVMSNHYHLALETPLANLSAGMQYLQSVFSNRFNKFVGERGHVFQGRYKALLLEDSTALLQVVDYIHLNPVRAGIVKLDELRSYSLSSFPAFFRRKGRPGFLTPTDFLHEAGGLSDSVSGMNAYHRRLQWVMEEDPEKQNKEFTELCRGWYVGTKEGKARLAGRVQDGMAKANADLQHEIQDLRWQRLFESGLAILGKKPEDCLREMKSAEWKLALGAWVKSQSSVPNRWLAETLHMGQPRNASKQMGVYMKERVKQCDYHLRLTSGNPK
jgi:putative transposase